MQRGADWRSPELFGMGENLNLISFHGQGHLAEDKPGLFPCWSQGVAAGQDRAGSAQLRAISTDWIVQRGRNGPKVFQISRSGINQV